VTRWINPCIQLREVPRDTALAVASALRQLESWPPCGERLAALQAAIAGEGGLTSAELARLCRWAAHWQRWRPELRAFYICTAPDYPQAGYALWLALEGQQPDSRLRGSVRYIWKLVRGGQPPFDLHPVPRKDP